MDSPDPGPPPLVRCFLRAWSRRCPCCGEGALFVSHFRLSESCDRCGLVYRKEPGALTGQMYLSAALTQLFAAALVFAIFLGTDWGVGLSTAVRRAIVVLFSYLMLPRAMATWAAIEYASDAVAPDYEGPGGPPQEGG